MRLRLIAAAPLLLFAIACADLMRPKSVVRIQISPDTVAFAVGDSAILRATVLDANGNALTDRPVHWSSNTFGITVHVGVVSSSVGGVFGSVSADADGVAQRAWVWAQMRAESLSIGVRLRGVSPGAHFTVKPTAYDHAGQNLDLAYPYAKAYGTIASSSPRVADWSDTARSGSDASINPGIELRALAVGVTQLTLKYGGLVSITTLVVSTPQLVTSDSSWNGGSWNHCGLTAVGEAWCQGSNYDGELGTLTAPWYHPPAEFYEQGSSVPVAVDTDVHFSRIVMPPDAICGIATTQRVYCWGRGDFSQLGGAVGKTHCYSNNYPGIAQFHTCSFVPVVVDRDLGQVLRFDDLRHAPGYDRSLCGHVVARGAAGLEATVDEVWCWGSHYGAPPTQRPGFFQ